MTSKSRIDMQHGFMRSIIRNQVDRDNYDKEVKAMKANKKQQSRNGKKPDLQPYVPPSKGAHSRIASLHDEESYLFKFEYEDLHGVVHNFDVYMDDNPSHIARQVDITCQDQLTPLMVRALSKFLKEEMDKAKHVRAESKT